jgi:hypothetical protein
MGREIFGDDHTGIDFERCNNITGIVIFWIAIPVLMSDVRMTVLVLLFFLITIREMASYVAMTVPGYCNLKKGCLPYHRHL